MYLLSITVFWRGIFFFSFSLNKFSLSMKNYPEWQLQTLGKFSRKSLRTSGIDLDLTIRLKVLFKISILWWSNTLGMVCPSEVLAFFEPVPHVDLPSFIDWSAEVFVLTVGYLVSFFGEIWRSGMEKELASLNFSKPNILLFYYSWATGVTSSLTRG